MTFPDALRKAIAIVRGEKHDRRAAYLQSSSSRYRLVPSDDPRGYAIGLSVRYDNQWQPWGDVDHFGVDDILCDKWSVV